MGSRGLIYNWMTPIFIFLMLIILYLVHAFNNYLLIANSYKQSSSMCYKLYTESFLTQEYRKEIIMALDFLMSLTPLVCSNFQTYIFLQMFLPHFVYSACFKIYLVDLNHNSSVAGSDSKRSNQ